MPKDPTRVPSNARGAKDPTRVPSNARPVKDVTKVSGAGRNPDPTDVKDGNESAANKMPISRIQEVVKV